MERRQKWGRMEEWRARLGNIGARLGGLLKQIGNWRSIGELGETGKLQTGARLEGLLKQKLASIFSYCSYQIIGQNKIKTGRTMVSKDKHWH